jgi:hypothetical protein
MFNLNNVNGYLSANNFISIVGNRYGSEYTADALNIQVGLLNGGLKAQLGPSYSLSVGADLQLGILSGLTESILAVDATPLTLNDNSSYYVKGLADILNVNGGNGVSGLTTNDAFKKKLEVPTTAEKAIVVNGKNASAQTNVSGNNTEHNKYSSDDVLKNHFSKDIAKTIEAFEKLTGDTEAQANPTIAAFQSAVRYDNVLFSVPFVEKMSQTPFNRTGLKDFRNKVLELNTKVDLDTFMGSITDGNNSQSLRTYIENLLSFDKNNEAQCKFVKETTNKEFNAGGTSSKSNNNSANATDVVLKVYNSGMDVSMSSLLSGNGHRELKFLIVDANGSEKDITEEEFFTFVSDDKISFGNQSRNIYLIGLFSDRKATVTRSVSLAFIPQIEIGGVYTAFSVQGVSFDAVGVSIKTPLLSLVSESVNNWTFALIQPFAANVSKGQKDVKTAFDEFSRQILGVNSDKSIADEVLSKTSDDAFKQEIAKSCIKPFATEDDSQWFIKNNYAGSIYVKLNNPLFNLLTAFQVNVQAKGKNYIGGISLATVYSFIKVV